MLAMWLNDWNNVLSGLCQSNIYMSAFTCARKRHVSGPYVPKRNSTKVSDWMTSLSYSLTIRWGYKKEHKVCSWVIENQGTTNKNCTSEKVKVHVIYRSFCCELGHELRIYYFQFPKLCIKSIFFISCQEIQIRTAFNEVCSGI